MLACKIRLPLQSQKKGQREIQIAEKKSVKSSKNSLSLKPVLIACQDSMGNSFITISRREEGNLRYLDTTEGEVMPLSNVGRDVNDFVDS